MEADGYRAGPSPARGAEVVRLAGVLEAQRSGCAVDVDGDDQLDLLLGMPAANTVALWSGFQVGIHAFADADWTWHAEGGAVERP